MTDAPATPDALDAGGERPLAGRLPEAGATPVVVEPVVGVSVTAATKVSASISPRIYKGLFSSPSRFVGSYEDDTVLLTHAWPSLSDPSSAASQAGPHSATSRFYYILAFQVPQPEPPRPGMVFTDWTFILEAATVALSIFFGKRFDSSGLIEGGGMFHVPQITSSLTLYPSFPPYNDDSRVDVDGELNFARCSWLTRWLSCGDNEGMRAVASAGKYYLRALRTFGHDATSAYVDLVMAGEILSGRHILGDEELYDDQLRSLFTRLAPKDVALVKKRLYQVRRRFSAGLRVHLNQRFFARTEAKGPSAEKARIVSSDIEKRLKAAYDVRSQYVHTGRTLGGHPHSMQGVRNEIQIGKPRTGNDELDEALEWAPTFLGLERVIRFGLLRVAHKEVGPLHTDLEDDPTDSDAI